MSVVSRPAPSVRAFSAALQRPRQLRAVVMAAAQRPLGRTGRLELPASCCAGVALHLSREGEHPHQSKEATYGYDTQQTATSPSIQVRRRQGRDLGAHAQGRSGVFGRTRSRVPGCTNELAYLGLVRASTNLLSNTS